MDDIDYSSIIELDLSNKQLNELPDLSKYTNLEILNCNNNNLTNLYNLPQSLKVLYCSENKLTDLTRIGRLSNLEILKCKNNNIKYIHTHIAFTQHISNNFINSNLCKP